MKNWKLLDTCNGIQTCTTLVAHYCVAAITYDANRTDITAAKEVMPHLLIAAFHVDISTENVTDGATHGIRMDVSKLPTCSRGDAEVYLCGPVAFMQAQRRGLLEIGVP